MVDNINLTVNHHDKIALIGNNGSGKSTLLKIIAKELQPYAFLNSPIFAPRELRSALPDIDKMKFGFDNSALHKGKILFNAAVINYRYNNRLLWKDNLTFQITSGERLALKGLNGSGKTTLIKIILGKFEPQTGTIYRADNKSVYIGQDYSLIDNHLKVYEQAQQFNASALQEHEIKIRLNRFLFTKDDWDKSCSALSGGEKMRLILCCLTISIQSPDIIILDEPTNNLDIQNIEILTAPLTSIEEGLYQMRQCLTLGAPNILKIW